MLLDFYVVPVQIMVTVLPYKNQTPKLLKCAVNKRRGGELDPGMVEYTFGIPALEIHRQEDFQKFVASLFYLVSRPARAT